MEKTIDVSGVPVTAAPAELGELSESDLEMVVGGLTRAWVGEAELTFSTTAIGAPAPAAPLLKPSVP